MTFSARLVESSVLTPGLRRFSPRQEEVLDVIEAVLMRDGIRGVRMGQLASEAGCSRSTLYEIAPSKQDLLLLVLDRIMRRISRQGAKAIAEAVGPVERARALAIASGALDLSALGPQFVDAVRQYPPARMLFDRWVSDGRDVAERLIDEAIVANEFRPVNGSVLAEAMLAIVLRFTDPDFARTTKISATAGLTEIVDIMLDGLRARAHPDPAIS